MSDKGLYEKLIEYRNNGKYPLHMPGHKREYKMFSQNDTIDPYEIDITEINDFDNLHHPEGIIKSSMDNAKNFFGTDRTFFLVNGSSCGLLAAINAVTDIGDSVLIGRNCHKAVYNALELRNLKAHYIYPQIIKEYGINGGYNSKEIEKELKKAQINGEKIKAVVLTSPTYEGIVSDIKSISEIVHKYGSVLIVDEAHGAHLGICERLPEAAYRLGADIVIESAHKTLPAMTQTAFLHLCGGKVDEEKLQDCLAMYQSSSPSYVLMASIDKCVRSLQSSGRIKLDELLITLEKFHRKVSKIKYFKVPSCNLIGKDCVYDFDACKLIIFSECKEISGKDLETIFRDKYNFEIEMTSARYVLAMTSMCDDSEKLLRLADALIEIDSDISLKLNNEKSEKCIDKNEEKIYKEIIESKDDNRTIFSIYQAKREESEMTMLKTAQGRVAAGYVYIYPPEIPLVVPGEMITDRVIKQLSYFQSIGLNVKGIEKEKIKVIKKSL